MAASHTSVLNHLKSQLKCPITGTYYVDPVVTCDGHTYERQAIERWLAHKHTSPNTGKQLSSKRLVPSLTLRQTITQLVNSHVIDKTSAGTWHVASGWAKFRGWLPGGTAAAKRHFSMAVDCGNTQAHVLSEALALMERAQDLQIDLGELFTPRRPPRRTSAWVTSRNLDLAVEALGEEIEWAASRHDTPPSDDDDDTH